MSVWLNDSDVVKSYAHLKRYPREARVGGEVHAIAESFRCPRPPVPWLLDKRNRPTISFMCPRVPTLFREADVCEHFATVRAMPEYWPRRIMFDMLESYGMWNLFDRSQTRLGVTQPFPDIVGDVGYDDCPIGSIMAPSSSSDTAASRPDPDEDEFISLAGVEDATTGWGNGPPPPSRVVLSVRDRLSSLQSLQVTTLQTLDRDDASSWTSEASNFSASPARVQATCPTKTRETVLEAVDTYNAVSDTLEYCTRFTQG